MKISSLNTAKARHEEGAALPIVDENQDPYTAADGTPATITVVGSESKRVRDAKDKQTRRLLRQQRSKLTPEDLRANRIELATAAVIAWHGFEGDDEQPIACTPENVSAVLGTAEHILVQVEEGVGRHASFFAASSTT